MELLASNLEGLVNWRQQVVSTPNASTRQVRRSLSLAEQRTRLNCFIEVFESEALAAAKLTDESLLAQQLDVQAPALLGLPFAVKDIFKLVGKHRLPTGGARFKDLCEGQMASPLVNSFVQAGAILLGTTNLDELCYGMTGLNAHFGAVRNPLDETRITGGSSSGSAAAVAAGIVPFALGSDTGGSIRVPAACCGIVGFKPSHGLFSLEGAVSLSTTQDCAGWLTPSVFDASVLFQVASEDLLKIRPIAVPLRNVDGLTFGILEHPFLAPEAPTIARDLRDVVDMLRSSGATVKTVDGKFLESCDLAAAAITGFEAALFHHHRIIVNPDMFSEPTLERLRRGQAINSDEYALAMSLRTSYQLSPPLKILGCDFFLAPTMLSHPPCIEELTKDVHAGLAYTLQSLHATRAFSFLGGPVISIPLAVTAGFPSSVQIVGGLLDDIRLLSVAKLIESAWLLR